MKFGYLLEETKEFKGATKEQRNIMFDGFISASFPQPINPHRATSKKHELFEFGRIIYQKEVIDKYEALDKEGICKRYEITAQSFLKFRKMHSIDYDFIQDRRRMFIIHEDNHRLFSKIKGLKNLHSSTSVKDKFEPKHSKNPHIIKGDKPRSGFWPIQVLIKQNSKKSHYEINQ